MSGPSFTCPRCGRTTYNTMDVAEGYCGHCHDWTSRDFSVVFRLWLGQGPERWLADETHVPNGPALPEALTAVAERHAHKVEAAHPLPYLVEIEFWDGQVLRWGTSAEGMDRPEAVASFDNLMDRLHAMVDQWHV